jgi:nitrate/nitrite transporter NarK
MLRNIGAVILGLLVGSALNMGLVMANMSLFPGPEGLDFDDAQAMAEYISGLPQSAFVLPLLAHVGQATLGGWVAARVGASRPMLLALIVGALTMVGGIMNMMNFPDAPVWMWVEFPLYLALPAAVGQMEKRRREGTATA